MSRLTILLLFAVAAGAATPAVFMNPPTIMGGDSIIEIRAGDVDGDTRADFIVLTRGSRLRVYRGNGDGTFRAPVITQLSATASDETDLAVADIDGDSLKDVVVNRMLNDAPWGTRVFEVHHGNGDGSFAAGARFSAPGCTSNTLVLAEMTGDTRPDIVTCAASILPNLGSGSFGPPIVPPDSYPPLSGERVQVADANDDGKLDIFVHASHWRSYASNGAGAVEFHASWPVSGKAAIADFDLDGIADVASFDRDSSELVLRKGSNPSVRVPGGYFPAPEEGTIAAADLNGDGRPDVMAGYDAHVYVWITTPAGSPGPRTIYSTGSSARALTTADFDADGEADILAAGDSGNPSYPPAISLMTGTGEGRLRAMRSHALVREASGSTPLPLEHVRGVTLSDVTSDGHLDVVAMGLDAIVVYPGSASGAIGTPVFTPATLDYFGRVYFGDFDDDGAIDLIARTAGSFVCWMANGDGTYRKTAEWQRVVFLQEAVGDTGDFNGDGKLDFVDYYGNVRVHLGHGDGTFAPAIVTVSDRISMGHVVDADVDGDHDLIFWDAVFLSSNGSLTRHARSDLYGIAISVDLNADGRLDSVEYISGSPWATTLVRLRNSDGTYGAPKRQTFDERLTWQALQRAVPGDFNGDGRADVAFDERVLLGDGSGSFNGFARFRYGSDVRYVAAGDLDGNGSDDLVYVNDRSGVIDVALTGTTDALELPLTITRGAVPAVMTAGADYGVTVTSTGETVFAPSGAVVFSVGGEVTAMAELVAGEARGSVHASVPGAHILTATYGGDERYGTATSESASVDVTRSIATVHAEWSSWPVTNRPFRVYGRIDSPLAAFPTGTVTLFIDGVVRDSQAAPMFDLSAGSLAVGTYAVRVEYDGDASNLPATRSFSITVRKPYPLIAVNMSPSGPAVAGSPVTITASFPDAPGITGDVRFEVSQGYGSTVLGQVTMAGEVASLTTSSLPVGPMVIRAHYLGDAQYAAYSNGREYTVVDAPRSTAPSSFYLLATPCRALDTRESAPLTAFDARTVQMSGVCGIPATAAALAINLTVVSPTRDGFITLYGGASDFPPTSTLNYRPGKTRANSAVIPLSHAGRMKLFNNGPGSSTNVIVDVTGYFQ